MPNGDIHEISKEIGMLVSGLKGMKDEVRGLREEFHRHNESMELKVNGLLEFKNKGAGLLLGVSLVAGGIGSFLHFVWDYLRGHGG